MSDVKQPEVFEVIETNEATALEEMGASSTISAGSTCSQQTVQVN
ncbi:thiopeptide-type bacteriocin [Pseudoalteromonas fenneropenaei]|uniref:Thiopeptide-type bacteriocin n=1 Tax=Pseudoalteromonas fenneropenaei TaxID=1737459 RepID=A0ABV7CKU6_9GAMM